MPDRPTAETLIAFDYGTQHIGVAVGQSITATANPLNPLKARDGVPNWDQVEALLKEWKPDRLIVGLPLNMDGSESELCQRSRKFGRRLFGRFNIPVETVDERLTSFEAKGRILEESGSREFKHHKVDSIAAQLILESWFNQQI